MTDDEARKLIDKHLKIPLNQFFGGNLGNKLSREMLVGLKWFLTEQIILMFGEIKEQVEGGKEQEKAGKTQVES